jgi:hypothetical protein
MLSILLIDFAENVSAYLLHPTGKIMSDQLEPSKQRAGCLNLTNANDCGRLREESIGW